MNGVCILSSKLAKSCSQYSITKKMLKITETYYWPFYRRETRKTYINLSTFPNFCQQQPLSGGQCYRVCTSIKWKFLGARSPVSHLSHSPFGLSSMRQSRHILCLWHDLKVDILKRIFFQSFEVQINYLLTNYSVRSFADSVQFLEF